jgi:hypothetical protein
MEEENLCAERERMENLVAGYLEASPVEVRGAVYGDSFPSWVQGKKLENKHGLEQVYQEVRPSCPDLARDLLQKTLEQKSITFSEYVDLYRI